MYEQQDDDEMIDTAPPGTYPDEMVSFSAGEDDGPERPEGDEDEPWDEFDAEDARGALRDGVVRRAGGARGRPARSSGGCRARSRRSASVEVGVDGELGPRTRRRAQGVPDGGPAAGRAEADRDGIAGPRTIAELELQTQSHRAGSGASGSEDDACAEVTEVTEVTEVAAGAQRVAPRSRSAPARGPWSSQIVKEQVVHHRGDHDGRDKVQLRVHAAGHYKHAKDAFCTSATTRGSKGAR
jgi:hypothetical protein